MKNRIKSLAGDISLIMKEHNNNERAFSEDKILKFSRAYIHIKMYRSAGNVLFNWLRFNESERVSIALDKLRSRVYLSEVKCKVIKVTEDSVLGHFGNTKYKTLGVVIDRYDIYGNVVEHIEKSGHEVDEYWRRDYVYCGDSPESYIEYDKDGKVTKRYSAVLDKSGKASSSTLTYDNKEVKTYYSYTDDGLLLGKRQTVNGKDEERYLYEYDDLDRVVTVTHYYNGNLENWNTTYKRKSNHLIRNYSKGHGIVRSEKVWNDFMGNPEIVYNCVYRSDAGWINSGTQYEYINKYSLK